MLGHHQHPADCRDAADAGDHASDDAAELGIQVAHCQEVGPKYNKRRNKENRFRNGGPEQVDVVKLIQKFPTFLNSSNNGEVKLGTIESSNRRGYNPMMRAVPMRMAAPTRSGTEMGSMSECAVAE